MALALVIMPILTAAPASAAPRSDYGCNFLLPWAGKYQIPLCIRVIGSGAYVSWIDVGISVNSSTSPVPWVPDTVKGVFLVHTTLPAAHGLHVWLPGIYYCRAYFWNHGVCWYKPVLQVNRDIGLFRGSYNYICADLYTYPDHKHEGGPACAKLYISNYPHHL